MRKQNFVLSGVETEFCFEWSGNRILFRMEWKRSSLLVSWKRKVSVSWKRKVLASWKRKVLVSQKRNSFGVLETEFRFHVTRKQMFRFLVFFCAYVLTCLGWSKNEIFEQEILLHHHFPVLLTQD
jgi:hypothetical protein